MTARGPNLASIPTLDGHPRESGDPTLSSTRWIKMGPRFRGDDLNIVMRLMLL